MCIVSYSTWLGMYQCVPWYVSTGWDIRIVCVYSACTSVYLGMLVRDGTLGLYVCTVSYSTWLGMYQCVPRCVSLGMTLYGMCLSG